MKIKYIGLLFLAMLLVGELSAQVLTINPTFPTADDAVVITYNTAEGNAALDGFTGDIYAHTGVITNLSTSSSDWRYVIAGWSENTTKAKLTPLGGGLYQFTISPSIREFYGVPAGETILKLAFVFRNSTGTIVGRESDGSDIFADVYQAGLNVSFELPASKEVFVDMNDVIDVKANSTAADSLAIYINDTYMESTTNASLTTSITATQSGKFWVKAIAYANSGADMAVDSFYYFLRPAQVVEALPAGVKDGINYIDDQTVILCLYAPYKDYVFAIGDFSDWQVSEDVYMKKTPDGMHYWVQLNNLTPGQPYIYQYLIDGTDRFADYYCDQVSDPWNDKYIDDVTYPNLPAYPEGKTSGVASVFTTGQTEYNWQVTNFQKPKNTDLVIYEVLLRDITTLHSYQSMIDTIGYFKRLGVNAIELMPVNEFEGNLSWGYNPDFYFAPDKYYGTKNDLKEFIDVCHQNGIAVIMDMVLNHSYGLNPMVHMYWDASNDRPAANNPWFNQTAPNTDYSWGYDFNHESPDTKMFVDSVTSYWINEYNVDGYRFDFTKGFTNTTGSGWNYDASRIAILKRMADKIWEQDPNAYVILEHFTDNSEEKVLAEYGMMVWGNMNGSYKEANMGYTSNGNSDLGWASYQARGWSKPHLVVYQESHDEERQMVYAETWGNTDGASYDITTKSTALDRMKLGMVFDFTIPGPKMLWQFEELGFDLSINYPSGQDYDRVSNKPPKWDYQFESRRMELHDVVSSLAIMKANIDAFETTDYQIDVYNALKRIRLNNAEMNIIAIGNFDVVSGNIAGSFQHTGTWYEFFTGNTLDVSDVNMNINLAAGEYRLYSDKPINLNDYTGIEEQIPVSSAFMLFPNPAGSALYVIPANTDNASEWKIYSIQGREVLSGKLASGTTQTAINISGLSSGIYIYELETPKGKQRQKLIKQ